MKKMIIAMSVVCALISCTDNQNVKSFGGTATIDLSPERKLLNVTWKEQNLWILTRPMQEGETAQTYKFQEHSSFGVMEGTYIIKEQKNK